MQMVTFLIRWRLLDFLIREWEALGELDMKPSSEPQSWGMIIISEVQLFRTAPF